MRRCGGLLAGFEEDLGRVRWATELLCLIDLFAALSDTQRVGVRMVATPRCTCPRFHTDAVGLRLLCTWQGGSASLATACPWRVWVALDSL
jgi:Protein of unknown function (DUF1826)